MGFTLACPYWFSVQLIFFNSSYLLQIIASKEKWKVCLGEFWSDAIFEDFLISNLLSCKTVKNTVDGLNIYYDGFTMNLPTESSRETSFDKSLTKRNKDRRLQWNEIFEWARESADSIKMNHTSTASSFSREEEEEEDDAWRIQSSSSSSDFAL